MTNDYKASRTLPYRIELVRQLKRRRTVVSYALMIALPLIVVAAVKLGPQSNSSSSTGSGGSNFGSGNLNLIGLATSGTWNFTLVMLLFGSGFLLTTVFAMFCGDTVASEASWATLRYLLATPVPRRRLLVIKLMVGLSLSICAILLLVVASLIIGALAFGSAALTSPLGGTFETTAAVGRLAIIVGYISITLLFACGIAFLMTVLTDAPLGAVGTAVILVIVSQILDALDALGDLRQWLPSHYSSAWTDALAPAIDWTSMARGASYSFIAFIACVSAAVLKFDRKDVLS